MLRYLKKYNFLYFNFNNIIEHWLHKKDIRKKYKLNIFLKRFKNIKIKRNLYIQ